MQPVPPLPPRREPTYDVTVRVPKAYLDRVRDREQRMVTRVDRRRAAAGAGAAPQLLEATTPAQALHALVDYALQTSPACQPLQALTGQSADGLDERVPVARAVEALEVAVRCTGDANFGLRFAEHGPNPVRNLDVLGYLFAAAPDVAAACLQAERFYRIWNQAADLRLAPGDGDRAFSLSTERLGMPNDRLGVAQLHVVVMAGATRVARAITGVDIAPRAVHFAAPAPPDTRELQRYFRAELRFDAPETALVLTPEILALPLRQADPRLLAVLTRHAQDRLERLPNAPATWVDQVRQLLVSEPSQTGAELAWVAKRLAMTPRTLQRRLRDEGTSFQALVDERRRDLAIRYLRDARLSVSEIAYLLGFNEISAFYRRFKRWTGSTPAEFRRRAG